MVLEGLGGHRAGITPVPAGPPCGPVSSNAVVLGLVQRVTPRLQRAKEELGLVSDTAVMQTPAPHNCNLHRHCCARGGGLGLDMQLHHHMRPHSHTPLSYGCTHVTPHCH